MVLAFPRLPSRYPLKISLPKMYEFATGHWLFKPEATNDIPRDVVHLAQMTQRTGQSHDDVALKKSGVWKKQHDLKGKETCLESSPLFTFTSRHVEARN